MNMMRVVYEDMPALISVPAQMHHRRTEVTFRLMDELTGAAAGKDTRRRQPPPCFAGKVREVGDVMNTAPAVDWGVE